MKWGRLSIALIATIQFQALSAQAIQATVKISSDAIDTSLFPIDKSPSVGTSVDDLFPTQPRITPAPGTPGGIVPGPTGSTGVAPTPTPNPGGIIGGIGPGIGVGGVVSTPGQPVTVRPSDVVGDFKCNLFENTDYTTILAAVNSLNAAVGSASCGASSQITVQGVVNSNKQITDAVKAVSGYLTDPSSVPPEQVPMIVNNVDVAIRAANSIATTFASSDLLNKNCRDNMSGGQVALAVNDIINGLTPYALMAASMTGGTAAIPFIVGGSVVTQAISSMNKIVNDNSTKVNDSTVRKAIIENVCQYIRVKQKFDFLTTSRDSQVAKISKEIATSQKYFSSKIQGLSSQTNLLVNRKNFLSQTSLDINKNLSGADAELKLAKEFITGTSDDIKVCNMGIQLAALSQDQTSYVSVMLASVDQALAAYGVNSSAEARTLKFSANIAVNSLNQMGVQAQTFTFSSDFGPCVKATKSLIETIDQTATLSKNIVKMAQDNLDKQLKASPGYSTFQANLDALNKKQLLAEQVTSSLDNLRKVATSFQRSDVAVEMDRLRQGLFATRVMGIKSPVMAWFNFVTNMQAGAVNQFKAGLTSLRSRSYGMTNSGKLLPVEYMNAWLVNKQVSKDSEDAFQLAPLDLKHIKEGSADQQNVCREMRNVWNNWVTAIDHLSAIESFCSMINPYIYDSNTDDRQLVQMCRGTQIGYGGEVSKSNLENMKNQLVKEHTADWAVFLKKKLDALNCPAPIAL